MNDKINTGQPLMMQLQCVECKFYDGFGQCLEHGNRLKDNCEDFELIFTELKESERMKKAIRHILYENYTDAAVIEGVEIAEIVAWLEKQGEQKQTWEPNAAQLIVIKDLIEDKNTSKVNKVILRGMLEELEKLKGL